MRRQAVLAAIARLSADVAELCDRLFVDGCLYADLRADSGLVGIDADQLDFQPVISIIIIQKNAVVGLSGSTVPFAVGNHQVLETVLIQIAPRHAIRTRGDVIGQTREVARKDAGAVILMIKNC